MFFPSFLFSQNVNGTIYDDKIILEYISVMNVTQNIETFSDENGSFEIKAIENDVLLFSSSFFIDKKVSVTKAILEKKIIINLEPNINNLEEVVISNNYFNVEQYNQDFKNQILYDVDHNMQAYEQPSNGSVDFRKIFKRVNKLLTKKNKKNPSTLPSYISHSELKLALLEKDFNSEKLIDVIEIKEENIYLFLDFCRGKIKKELLEDENSFRLLDQLIKLSSDFKNLSED